MEKNIISFEIETREKTEEIKKILRILGARKIKIKSRNQFSLEFLKRLEEAKKEKEENKLIEVDPKDVWKSLGLK